MRIIIFAFIIALLVVNFPVAVSLIVTNAKFNKEGGIKKWLWLFYWNRYYYYYCYGCCCANIRCKDMFLKEKS